MYAVLSSSSSSLRHLQTMATNYVLPVRFQFKTRAYSCALILDPWEVTTKPQPINLSGNYVHQVTMCTNCFNVKNCPLYPQSVCMGFLTVFTVKRSGFSNDICKSVSVMGTQCAFLRNVKYWYI